MPLMDEAVKNLRSTKHSLALARAIVLALICSLAPFTLTSPAFAAAVSAASCQLTAPGAPACASGPTTGSTPDERQSQRYVGNPIDVVTGNKYQREDDFLTLRGALNLVRHYNSTLDAYDMGLGPGWRHSYQVVLYKSAASGYRIVQSDGRAMDFTEVSGTSTPVVYRTNAPSDGVILIDQKTTWHVPDGRSLRFHGSFLVAITHPHTRSHLRLHYTHRRLDSVRDQYGQILRFAYAGRDQPLPDYDNELPWAPPGALSSVSLPDGTSVRFGYDRFRRLRQVSYHSPHGAVHTTKYAYDSTRYRYRLTSRESSVDKRLTSWSYDDEGRANSWTEHGRTSGLSIEYSTGEYSTGSTEPAMPEATVSYRDGRTERYLWQSAPSADPADSSVSVHCAGCAPARPSSRPDPDSGYRPAQSATDVWDAPFSLTPKSVSSGVWTLAATSGNGSAEIQVSTDRLGQVTEIQTGDVKLSELSARLLNATPGQCPARTPTETGADAAPSRLAALADGATPCTGDVLLLLDLKNELEASNREESGSGNAELNLSPRVYADRPKPDPYCNLPAGKSCADLEEDRDMALLSGCVYIGGVCPTGMQAVDPLSIGMDPTMFDSNGFHAHLFYDAARDRYTLAFRGTDGIGDDWESNIAQGKGEQARQYDLAMDLAQELAVSLPPGSNLNFTGHSLGGGLATLAALSTGAEATIFNSAALHPDNAIRYGVQNNYVNAGSFIDHLSTASDPLTSAQSIASTFGLYGNHVAPGRHTVVPNPGTAWMYERYSALPYMQQLNHLLYHSIEAVIKSIDTLRTIHCATSP